MFDAFEDGEQIPSGLDQLEPGPFLAAILAHTDVNRLVLRKANDDEEDGEFRIVSGL